MNAHARIAVTQAISAARDDLADPRTFERRVILAFGQARGRELLKRGNAAILDAAEALCARCVDRLARGHWSYDMNEHIGAKAIYDATRERIRVSEASFFQAAE